MRQADRRGPVGGRSLGPLLRPRPGPHRAGTQPALVQVFDDVSAAHHRPNVFWLGEDARVSEWVVVEDDEVGALALFDGADLLIDAHQLRIRPGGRDDRVHGTHDTRLAGDLLTFLAL